MQESKRQLQVAKLVNEELSRIFTKENLTMMHGGLVSIAKVSITPDLLEARVSLSFFKIDSPKEVLNIFFEKTPEIRRQLGNSLRHHLRRIPTITFKHDDTLDYVFKMEELLDSIRPTLPESESPEGEQ